MDTQVYVVCIGHRFAEIAGPHAVCSTLDRAMQTAAHLIEKDEGHSVD